MAAPTPVRESKTVNNGEVFNFSSSLIPPNTPASITKNISNARPEYRIAVFALLTDFFGLFFRFCLDCITGHLTISGELSTRFDG